MDFHLSDALALLERTPATLRALLSGMPEAWTAPDEGPGTFSARDNLAHLLHADRTNWVPRARIILAQGPDRRFDPFDRFGHLRQSEGVGVEALLEQFEAVRAANLERLRGWSITGRELALQGEHPELGAVTLAELLATWVAHDLAHLAQTARVMARQYRDAVGPWRAYLPILDR